VSSWAEREAYESAEAVIAVSRAMRDDILRCFPAVDPERIHVISNGVDTEYYRPDTDTHIVDGLGIDLDRPYVAFVGRVTRQKGLSHLLTAARELDPDTQLAILAGEADTPALTHEINTQIEQLRTQRSGIVLVPGTPACQDRMRPVVHSKSA